MTVSFTIWGNPTGKGRPKFARVGNGVRTYTPDATANYEAFVKSSYLDQVGQVKLEGQLCVSIYAIFQIPKSATKKQQYLMREQVTKPTKKPDCDNIAKIILDSLNGIAFDDDKQVCRLCVEKRYGDTPCVEVTIWEDKIN